MPYQIRLARAAEYDAVGEVTATAYLADELLSPDSEYVPTLRDAADRAANAELWVAADGDHVLGTVTYCPPASRYRELARDEGDGEFRMLAVHPDARGRGVGEALISQCIERARAFGARRVVLSTQSQMTAAQRLYKRFGFVRLPELDWRPLPDVALLAFSLELPPDTLT